MPAFAVSRNSSLSKHAETFWQGMLENGISTRVQEWSEWLRYRFDSPVGGGGQSEDLFDLASFWIAMKGYFLGIILSTFVFFGELVVDWWQRRTGM